MYNFQNITMDDVHFTTAADEDMLYRFGIALFILIVMVMAERISTSFFSSVSFKLMVITVLVVQHAIEHLAFEEEGEEEDEEVLLGDLPGRLSFAMLVPIVILKITSRMDMYLFRRYLVHILILSTVGMFLFGILVGFTTYHLQEDSKSILWVHLITYGFTFGGVDDVEISKPYLEYETIRDALVILDGEYILTTAFSILGVKLSSGVLDGLVSEWYQMLIISIRYIAFGVAAGYPFGWFIAFILPYMIDDIPNMTTSLIILVYLIYYVCENVFCCSGTIATFIACTYTIEFRKKISPQIDTFLKIFFDLIYSLGMYAKLLTAATIEIHYIMEYATAKSIVHYLSTFFTCFISRMFVLVLLYPVFKCTSKHLNVDNMMVLFWLSKKGVLQIVIVDTFFHTAKVEDSVKSMGGHIMFTVAFGLIFQSIFCKIYLDSLSRNRTVINRKSIIKNCIKLLDEKNNFLIDYLKVNRLFTEIKWKKVHEATFTYDPHTSLVHIEATKYNLLGLFCEECKEEIYVKPIGKEFLYMLREAKLRLLRAHIVCIRRLFCKSLIDEKTTKYILRKLEKSIESKDLVFLKEELVDNLKKRTFLDTFKDFLLNIGKEEIKLKPPRKRFRRICYNIVTFKGYIVLMYLLQFSYPALFLYRAFFAFNWFMSEIETAYATAFGLDCYMKVMACSHIYIKEGIVLYMSDKWNMLDCLMFFGNAWLSTYYMVKKLFRLQSMPYAMRFVMITIRQFSLLRLLRTFVILYQLRLWAVKMTNLMLSKRKSFCYDVAKALLLCHDDIIHRLPTMAINPDIYNHLMHLLEIEQLKVQNDICYLNLFSPSVISKHHTQMGCHGTLNFLKASVERLRKRGVFENNADEILNKIEWKIKLQMNVPLSFNAKNVFKNIAWLQDNKIFNLAKKNATDISWKENDVIIEAGLVTTGVVILTEGLLMSHYDPSTSTLEQLKKYGVLPIADYHDHKELGSNVPKCLVPGSSIGLLGILTGRQNDATVVAKVDSKGFYIPEVFFLENASRCPDHPTKGLYSVLWKYVSYEIVFWVLWESNNYRRKSREELFPYMHRSFVPYLCDRRTFVGQEFVKDIILIEGLVEDIVSKIIYRGPACIPRGIKYLRLMRGKDMVEPKLWIIPTKNAVVSKILKYQDFE